MTVAAPSDHESGFKLSWRDDPAHARDTAAVIEAASTRFPGKPIYLAGYAEAAISLLHYAINRDSRVAGYVLLGGYYGAMREEAVERIDKPVLMLHARTHKCVSAPLVEARELAQRGRFRMIDVGYPSWEPKPLCGATSQNALNGLDAEYAAAIVQWMRDGTAADAIGPTGVPAAYHEEVQLVPDARLEISVFRPQGTGPFPLVVFNHGDVDIDKVYIKKRARYRNLAIASLFGDAGFAVAFPQRPGVGRSAGTYPLGFSRTDGDATYKGREHAAAILVAIELPYVQRDRLVVAGQSAGGFATMYIASTNPPWLVAAINFSGGRSNIGWFTPSSNRMMVDAFATFGSTTKIPMLWIFAENDSFYPKEVIVASHRAFEAAGGRAKLLLFPPLDKIDGHYVINVPKLWQEELTAYLLERGLGVGAGHIFTQEAPAGREAQ